MIEMARRVLWFLFCSLIMVTAVHGLDNCLPSREAYVNLTLGDAEDVPEDFISGKSTVELYNSVASVLNELVDLYRTSSLYNKEGL